MLLLFAADMPAVDIVFAMSYAAAAAMPFSLLPLTRYATR